MPVEILFPTETPPPVFPPRKRWTRAECEAMEASGLCDGERLELIDGELISRMGKKRPHVIVMALIQEWLTSVFGARYVTPEAPIDVAPEDIPTNEPEPDLAVTTRPCEEYPRNPQPRDIRLLVEISDTTLAFDLRKKARLYARAGISEYWVVDIAGRRVFVHREPQGDKYETVTAYGETESVAPLAAPDRFLPVGDAFPGSALP